MKKRNLFISNALLLSIVSIILRGISVSFNAYVNKKIGAESMGLFTLVMNVYGFAVTLALSCVNLGAVKLTSERCAKLIGCDKGSWKKSMGNLMFSVCFYSVLFSVASGILLYSGAEMIAEYLLNDMRCVIALKILALSLTPISLSSALSGFFTGLRKVYKNAIASVSEQFVKIILTSTALFIVSPGNVESACLAVVGGSALGEAWSLIINALMYVIDKKKPNSEVYGEKTNIIKTKLSDVFGISFTAALGTYARQGLSTLEHLAIPAGLKKSGLDKSNALASYGLLQGIAFPLVMFPYAVISSFTSLLIPEMAEMNELDDRKGITSLTKKVYRYSAIFSLGACGIFVNYASELGAAVYNSTEASIYTVLLGLLVPFMYLDTAVDSLLKGLGEQVYNMKVNIADSAAGLILVMLLTPRMGIMGYILTVWVCEVGNLAASINRLRRVTGVGAGSAISEYVIPIVGFSLLTIIKHTIFRKLTPVISMVLFSALYTVSVILLQYSRKEKRDLYTTSLN